MRSSLLTSSLITTLILTSFTSCAYARAYFSVKGGLAETQESEIIEKRTDSPVFSTAIGSYIGPLRFEGEYTYISPVEFKEFETEAKFHRAMVQSYIDIPMTRYVLPYLNAGAGVSYYDVDYISTNQNGTNFTWNAGAGVGIRLTKNLTADMGVRYVDMGSVKIKNTEDELNFNSYETYAGIRFLF